MHVNSQSQATLSQLREVRDRVCGIVQDRPVSRETIAEIWDVHIDTLPASPARDWWERVLEAMDTLEHPTVQCIYAVRGIWDQ
ncbi:MAG: hypothetical protein AAF512_25375 [Pseudomonadota bacterium]